MKEIIGTFRVCLRRVFSSAPALFLLTWVSIFSILPVSAAEDTSGYFKGVPGRIDMNLIGRYDVDTATPEGGLEIVAYNEGNKTAYAVDGENRVLMAVPMSLLQSDKFTDLSSIGHRMDLAGAVEAEVSGFKYGDITSVAVSPDHSRIALSIQAKAYNEGGIVAVYPIDDSEDTLGEPDFIKVGIQPDMVVFADNHTVLTADEGEPRMGYGTNSDGVAVEDPKGSVSIVDLTAKTSKIVTFDRFDAKRNALVSSGVLMAKGRAPSVDFEPEYIAVHSDGSKAYVSLQENNALAILDIKAGEFINVLPFGFKNHNIPGNEIYLDGTPQTYPNILGAYMPDGISVYEYKGRTYILTANEGDGREWSSGVYPEGHENAGDPHAEDPSYHKNEATIAVKASKGDEIEGVVVIDRSVTDGLPEGKEVLFGGRSFSIFRVTNKSITRVYDSRSDFENTTKSFYPEWFNASYDNLEPDDRSKEKGPEPESVTVGKVGDRYYAFVALERMGGIMAYDITDPLHVEYSNYINTRDFDAEDGIGGDSGPEGMAFIAAAGSPTGKALLITGNEVTGTMPVYELETAPGDLRGKLVIIHTNDTHGGDAAVSGKSIGMAGIARLVKDYEGAGAEVLLVSAGDAIQGDPLVNLSNGLTAIEFMNLAGYDFMVPGNHEFDFGFDNLKKLEEVAEFPFLSANILDVSGNKPVFEDHLIFETIIGKVGVFGLTTPETLTIGNPKNVVNLSFPEGEALYEIARQQVNELTKAGAEYIICVAHLGIDEGSEPNRATDVVEHVKGIDLMIDGHSHIVLDGDEKEPVMIASAGTKFNYAGVVIMDDRNIEARILSAKEYSRIDPSVDIAVDAVGSEMDKRLSETFAKTEVLLDGNRAPGVRTRETNLGDFVGDAILWAAREAVSGPVHGAINNGGGIRASISIGNITMKDMKTVFPFSNTIATVRVTGGQLLEILEAATFITPSPLGSFPQVAGIEFTINESVPYVKGMQYPDSPYFAPANPGARISNVKVGGEALKLDQTYTIATNDFLAAGGDTYYLFKKQESYDTYVSLEDALINYTNRVLGGVISQEKYGQPAGRITFTEGSSAWQPGASAASGASGKSAATEVSGAVGGTYRVEEGDSLWTIAEKYLGNGARYVEIHELNKGLIKDINMIFIGQVLKIPAP